MANTGAAQMNSVAATAAQIQPPRGSSPPDQYRYAIKLS
jgi:hypothetical protein